MEFFRKPFLRLIQQMGFGNEVFKDGEQSLGNRGVVVFLGAQGPADALGFPQLLAQLIADGILPVGEVVGDKVRHGKEVTEQVGHGKAKEVG